MKKPKAIDSQEVIQFMEVYTEVARLCELSAKTIIENWDWIMEERKKGGNWHINTIHQM
jgi:hypothetical protein